MSPNAQNSSNIYFSSALGRKGFGLIRGSSECFSCCLNRRISYRQKKSLLESYSQSGMPKMPIFFDQDSRKLPWSWMKLVQCKKSTLGVEPRGRNRKLREMDSTCELAPTSVWSVEIDLGWLVGGRDDRWSCCRSVSVFEWCCSGLFRQIGLSFIGN